jgi:hypothetical protein
MHKSIRPQKNRQISNLNGTIRIAAIIQKSMTTGRSSYVEMRAVSRLVVYNIKSRVNSIKPLISNSNYPELLSISAVMSNGYEFTLTPNGIVKVNELERLLSTDSDIAILLLTIEKVLKSNNNNNHNNSSVIEEDLAILRELLNKRRRLVDVLKA